MRHYSVIVAAVVVAVCSSLNAQQTALPVFKNRALVLPPGQKGMRAFGSGGGSTASGPGKLPPEIVQEHGAVSEAVLLIRDHAVVDHPDFDSDPPTGSTLGPWIFAAVIRAAFQRAKATDPK